MASIASWPHDVRVDGITAVISAVAATIAAILAGAGLVVSGRREHAKWARDALAEALVSFLDLSFRAKDEIKYGLRNPDLAQPEIDKRLGLAYEYLAEMESIESRLRLLAPPPVINTAHELKVATRNYIRQLNTRPTQEQDRDHRGKLWKLRTTYVVAAKGAIALPRQWRRLPAEPSGKGN